MRDSEMSEMGCDLVLCILRQDNVVTCCKPWFHAVLIITTQTFQLCHFTILSYSFICRIRKETQNAIMNILSSKGQYLPRIW